MAKFTTERDVCSDEREKFIRVYADGMEIGEVYEDIALGFYIATYTFRRKIRRQATAKHPLRAGFAWLKEIYRRNA